MTLPDISDPATIVVDGSTIRADNGAELHAGRKITSAASNMTGATADGMGLSGRPAMQQATSPNPAATKAK
jgi:hypothetical protein